MKKPLIIIAGPTAVGKTASSIAIAKAVNGEIISADSMQVYKYMNIGSAKITKEEMDGVKHYLVDELDPKDEFHVVRFQQMAKDALQKIYDKGKVPILVGGTGFYIQALVNDIDFTKENSDETYREKLETFANAHGNEALHQKLKEVDEASALAIHVNNRKRVIRALEFYHLTGTPISKHNEEEHKKTSPYNTCFFVLNDERSTLYARIDQRVDLMLKQGLLEEVKKLKDMGCTKDMVSMQGLGYKEMLSYLNGEISYEEAVYILKRDTRHFAKRQITWFKRENDVIWIMKNEYQNNEEMINDMLLKIKERGI